VVGGTKTKQQKKTKQKKKKTPTKLVRFGGVSWGGGGWGGGGGCGSCRGGGLGGAGGVGWGGGGGGGFLWSGLLVFWGVGGWLLFLLHNYPKQSLQLPPTRPSKPTLDPVLSGNREAHKSLLAKNRLGGSSSCSSLLLGRRSFADLLACSRSTVFYQPFDPPPPQMLFNEPPFPLGFLASLQLSCF